MSDTTDDKLISYRCPSCRGTGLDGPTYDDVWNACQECDGAGELFEEVDE
jgi:DnaJ-class molecular chaperone